MPTIPSSSLILDRKTAVNSRRHRPVATICSASLSLFLLISRRHRCPKHRQTTNFNNQPPSPRFRPNGQQQKKPVAAICDIIRIYTETTTGRRPRRSLCQLQTSSIVHPHPPKPSPTQPLVFYSLCSTRRLIQHKVPSFYIFYF